MPLPTEFGHPCVVFLSAALGLAFVSYLTERNNAAASCLPDNDNAFFFLMLTLLLSAKLSSWISLPQARGEANSRPEYGLAPAETALAKGILAIMAAFGYLYAPRGWVYDEIGMAIWATFAIISAYMWSVQLRLCHDSVGKVTNRFVYRITLLFSMCVLLRPHAGYFDSAGVFDINLILLSHLLVFCTSVALLVGGLSLLFVGQVFGILLLVLGWIPRAYMPCLYVQLLASYGTVAALANNWTDVVKVAVITALPLAARSNYYTLVVLALFSPCYFIMPRTKFATIKLPSSLVLAGDYSLELCILKLLVDPHSHATHPSILSVSIFLAQAAVAWLFRKLSRITFQALLPVLYGLVFLQSLLEETVQEDLSKYLLLLVVGGVGYIAVDLVLRRCAKVEGYISVAIVLSAFLLLHPQPSTTRWATYVDCSKRNYVVSDGEALLISPPSHFLNESMVRTLIKDRRIVFVGDSIMRFVYFGVRHAIDNSLGFPLAKYHSDLSYKNASSGGNLYFNWAPYIANLSNSTLVQSSFLTSNTILLIGNGPWDALHTRSVEQYTNELRSMRKELCRWHGKVDSMLWLTFGNIVDSKLLTAEKRTWLNSDRAKQYRRAVHQSGVLKCFKAVVDMETITRGRAMDTMDGIHYSERTYTVAAQVFLNVLSQQ